MFNKELKKEIGLLKQEIFNCKNKTIQLETLINNYNSENYRLQTLVHAIVNYLDVDIGKDLVADPRYAPVEQYTTEIIVLKAKSKPHGNKTTRTPRN